MPVRVLNDPIYRPAGTVSMQAGAALAEGRFVVPTDGEDPASKLTIAGYPAANAPRVSGVTGYGAAVGQEVAVWRKVIIPVTASAAITAPTLVATTADGRAVATTDATVAVGRAWSDASAAGVKVNVELF
jgi:hypothetical protein